MRPKLSLITLGVADVAAARSFYEALGWTASERSMEGLALFPLGGMVLALHPRNELAADATVPDAPTGFAGLMISYNATSESEVDAVLAEAQAAGGTLVKPAQKVYWGGYSGYFRDPDGHLFEVAYNPFWPLDDKGNLDL